MIFPEHCKYVGRASTKPCGDRVYALSRYLLRDTPEGLELLEITLDPHQKTLMRDISSSRILARPQEIFTYPEKVQLNDRTRLVRLALESGYRCTVFTGLEENMTFVLDPDLSYFLTVHVYDVIPPRPTLSASLSELESIGLFGDLSVLLIIMSGTSARSRQMFFPAGLPGIPARWMLTRCTVVNVWPGV